MRPYCAAVRRFFALPLEVKKGAARSQDNSMGYFNDEFTKQKLDLKEGFDFRHVQVGSLSCWRRWTFVRGVGAQYVLLGSHAATVGGGCGGAVWLSGQWATAASSVSSTGRHHCRVVAHKNSL